MLINIYFVDAAAIIWHHLVDTHIGFLTWYKFLQEKFSLMQSWTVFFPLPHLSRSVLTNYQNVIKKEKKRDECQEIEPVEISQTFEDISYFPPLPERLSLSPSLSCSLLSLSRAYINNRGAIFWQLWFSFVLRVGVNGRRRCLLKRMTKIMSVAWIYKHISFRFFSPPLCAAAFLQLCHFI